MAEPLKNLYSPALLSQLADGIKKQAPSFDKPGFLAAVFDKEWKARELKQRMRHITVCLNTFLPMSYAAQLGVLRKAAPGFSGFTAILFPDFVATYGLEHPDLSIPALAFFTPFSSSEFAVRPFISRYESRMIRQHLVWAKDKNHHVRRLASEGIRPRLPWGEALVSFKKDPGPLLPILELLKQDESEYVRRSVANNLNDISKDHPGVVLSLIKKWRGLSKETDWIVKHASRGLLKKGHLEALSSFGLDHHIKATVSELKLSKTKLRIGDSFSFSFMVQNTGKQPADGRLEYRIYFVKSNGKPSPKIFQVGTYSLKPGLPLSFTRTHKFADLTTRKHYKGAHAIAIVLNGKEVAREDFSLR